jgi:hypothetical protein
MMESALKPPSNDEPAHVLVVANETIGGKKLLEAVDARARRGPIRATVICPRNEPPFGYVIYDDSSHSAAQIRLDLTLSHLKGMGIEASGEVMDPDPFLATQDAVRYYGADEIIISTYPYPRSGVLRKDLVQRIRDWSGLPVEHVVIDLNDEPVRHAIVVANQTVSGGPLLDSLKRRASQSPHRFTVICPIGGDGDDDQLTAARKRLGDTLSQLRAAGLEVVGQVMDRDPLTSVQNAVRYHPADEIIVSTLSRDKSRWLRGDLIDDIRKSTGLPVEHVVGESESESEMVGSRA